MFRGGTYLPDPRIPRNFVITPRVFPRWPESRELRNPEPLGMEPLREYFRSEDLGDLLLSDPRSHRVRLFALVTRLSFAESTS